MGEMLGDQTPVEPGLAGRIWRWGGLVIQVGIGIFPLSASGLLAPLWALVVIAAGWAAGVIVAWRVGRRAPHWTLVVPVVTLGAWFAFLTVGERVLGWTP